MVEMKSALATGGVYYTLDKLAEEDQRISDTLNDLVRATESFHSSTSGTVIEGPRSTQWDGSVNGDLLTTEQSQGIHKWLDPTTDCETEGSFITETEEDHVPDGIRMEQYSESRLMTPLEAD
jgi:hypothetical protein